MYISTVEDNICLWQDYFGLISFFLKSKSQMFEILKWAKIYVFYIYIYRDSGNNSSTNTVS